MPRRFFVVDGADKGQSFPLPESGKLVIGNSRKNVDICLHDLLASRVHCEVELDPSRVTVTELSPKAVILVNGVATSRHDLQFGDIMRVGNSFLKLEEFEPSADAAEPAKEEPPKEKGEAPLVDPEKLGELSGYNLGHFQLGRLISRGYFGAVFRALDTKREEAVALKILSPVFPDGDGEMQEFIRVTKQRLGLQNAALVPVRGAGRIGPYVWISMELIEGESLAQALERLGMQRKVPWRPALRFARVQTRLLNELYRQRMVHGNITPSNILFSGDLDSPLLNDLGLWQGVKNSRLFRETWQRKRKAEKNFLAPEYLSNELPIDDLSDQYCLGAVIYAMMTGRAPFAGTEANELADVVRTSMPQRPKEIQSQIPDDFQAIVLRMMAKLPEERFPSPSMILDELDQVAEKYNEDSEE